jgi:sugar/nucleoside kinase (ribokinase family)
MVKDSDVTTPVVVAGHTCLDLIPTLPAGASSLAEVLAPGQMLQVGAMTVANGGTVPNTGLAMDRLGVPVRLAGKVGDDAIGRLTLDLLRRHGGGLADAMVVDAGADSSYTVILSAPGIDRTFLHNPGPNDTFQAEDIPEATLADAVLFHFGYPTLMRRMFREDGRALQALFRRAKAQDLVTSLDVSQPDPRSEAGRADWRAILERVLPDVDLFLPGLEEALFMVDRDRFERLYDEAGAGAMIDAVDESLLGDVAGGLLDLGAAVVGLKMGDQGMYLRTTDDLARWEALAGSLPLEPRAWLNRELLAPAFRADLVGTTGAGDCTVAGFLTGVLRGLTPEDALTAAVAAGSSNVEAADALSGVPSWDDLWVRVEEGWEPIPTRIRLRGWGWDRAARLWIGAWDRGGLLADDERSE